MHVVCAYRMEYYIGGSVVDSRRLEHNRLKVKQSWPVYITHT